MIKEFEEHEARNHCALMKNIEVNNKHINKDGKLKTVFFIFSFRRKRFPDGILIKHK